MTKSKTDAPKAGVKGFSLSVFPSRDALDVAIAANGFCNPTDCWHYVAISALLEKIAPRERHMVKVDAGHVKVNYRGWRYIADTPLHVKRSLMLFDKKRYDEVHVREYKLRFRRTTKIITKTRAQKDVINSNRAARVAAGGDERKRKYPDLRARVEGFSGIV